MKTLKNKENTLSFIFLLLALLLSSALLFTAEPYYGHDIGFHLSRIQSIADCLNNKTFPALVYPNYFYGYGYANGIFYPDLFLYIPAILVWLGIECKRAYQIFMFLVNLATLLSMYFCVNRIIQNRYTSSVITCLYLLCSYRITDLYVRSALGETLCFIFMPFVMLGIFETLFHDPKNGYFLIIGLFGILSSHIITLLSCVVFIIAVWLLCLPKMVRTKELVERTRYLFIWCVLSVGICAYFLFPFIEAYLSDTYLFKTSPATGGWDRAMPFLLSLIEIPTYQNVYSPLGIGIVFIVLLIIFILLKMKDHYKNDFVTYYLILGLLFWILSTDLFPWTFLKGFAQLIQFPWRFLIIATSVLFFGFAPVLDEMMKTDQSKIRNTILMICCAGFTVLCFAFDMYVIEDFSLYHDEIHYSVGGVEYMPSDVDLTKLETRGSIVLSNHDIAISSEKNGTSMTIEYKDNSYNDTYLEAPLVYYKGYKAKDGTQKLDVSKSENGFVKIPIKNDHGTISLHYGFTVFRIVGYLISLSSLILLVMILRKL